MTDEEIAMLQRTGQLEAWARAVDPHYAELQDARARKAAEPVIAEKPKLKAPAGDFVTWKSLKTVFTKMGESFGKAIAEAIAKKAEPLAARLAAAEARIAALEGRKSLSYEGVWRNDIGYVEGSFVTDKGGTWYCRKSTCARPGQDADAWILTAKSHRGDAR